MSKTRPITPRFFRTPAAFGMWLEKHHADVDALWVGYYKTDTGKPSLTWPESVDEALCFGWIDGIRKRIDDVSYMIRFTPRRPGSIWSSVNTARARALVDERRMQPAGLRAFEARIANTSGVYSYEQRPAELPEVYARLFKQHRAAWTFFHAQPPAYRRAATWWIVSAKQDATRLKRLDLLQACSADGRRLPQFTLQKPR